MTLDPDLCIVIPTSHPMTVVPDRPMLVAALVVAKLDPRAVREQVDTDEACALHCCRRLAIPAPPRSTSSRLVGVTGGSCRSLIVLVAATAAAAAAAAAVVAAVMAVMA